VLRNQQMARSVLNPSLLRLLIVGNLASSQFAPDIIAIEPRSLKHCLVTTEALTQRKFHVAFEPRPGRGEMIFAGPLARSQHGCPRTRHPYPLIREQRLIEIVGVARDRG